MIDRGDNLIFHGEINNPINIMWAITKFCNFNCHYCYQRKPGIKLLNEVDLLKIVDFIFNLNHDKYNIIITGGEATLHPMLIETLEYLIEQSYIKNKKISIVLFSNLHKSINFYEDFFNLNKKNPEIKISLFASFHREFISINEFIEKLKYLKSKKYSILPFSFMIHNDICIDLLNSIKNELVNIPFILTPIFGLKLDYKKIDPSLKSTYPQTTKYSIFHKDGDYSYKLGNLKDVNFRGFICSVFKQQIVIDPTGLISPCQLFKYSKELYFSDKNTIPFIKSNEYTLCPIKECNCGMKYPKIHYNFFNKLKNINENYILNNIKLVNKYD